MLKDLQRFLSLKGLRRILLKKYWFETKSHIFNLLFTIFVFVVYNLIFFKKFFSLAPSINFAIGGVVCLLLLFYTACTILMFRFSTKFWAVLFILFNACVMYFMCNYQVAIDKIMLLNLMETDVKEIKEIFSLSMFGFLVLYAVLPIILILKTKITYSKFGTELLRRAVILFVSVLIVGGIVFSGYKTTAQFMRNNRHIRYSLIPVNYIGAVITVIKIKMVFENKEIEPIGEDVKAVKYWENDKRMLFVWVIGETARTANWGLSGYERNTTEPLDEYKNEILNFTNTNACGTSTNVSLPCMFDKEGRRKFNVRNSYNQENIVDIVTRAGFKVWWRNNNSSCKGVCARVEEEEPCKKANGCFDDVLVDGLKNKILSENKNMMVVLHQMGSHGPTYSMRYPEEFEIYKPACKTERLDKCSNEEIVNVYDNTIYYTAKNISDIIKELKPLEDEYNIVLMYVSDHGESLGEKGLYLHAAPYVIAPDEQKEVPFLFWITDDIMRELKIDKQCMNKKLNNDASHDNLFHTVLGILGLKTNVYNKNLDLFASCQNKDFNH